MTLVSVLQVSVSALPKLCIVLVDREFGVGASNPTSSSGCWFAIAAVEAMPLLQLHSFCQAAVASLAKPMPRDDGATNERFNLAN